MCGEGGMEGGGGRRRIRSIPANGGPGGWWMEREGEIRTDGITRV